MLEPANADNRVIGGIFRHERSRAAGGPLMDNAHGTLPRIADAPDTYSLPK